MVPLNEGFQQYLFHMDQKFGSLNEGSQQYLIHMDPTLLLELRTRYSKSQLYTVIEHSKITVWFDSQKFKKFCFPTLSRQNLKASAYLKKNIVYGQL